MSRDILLSLIDAGPEQPRKNFDPAGIDELAQSMAALEGESEDVTDLLPNVTERG